MRHLEFLFADPLVPVKHQVQIQRARGAGKGAGPAPLALDLEQRAQQVARGQRRVADDDGAEEPWLITDANGRRVEPRGLPEILEDDPQPVRRKGEMRLAIAKITAERDGGEGRGLLHPAGAEHASGVIVDRERRANQIAAAGGGLIEQPPVFEHFAEDDLQHPAFLPSGPARPNVPASTA